MNLKNISYDTKRKIILSSIAVFSLIITVLFCVAVVFYIYGDSLLSSKKVQLQKAENYAELATTTQKNGVVFLGDSIFEMYDLDKYFQGRDYINRGISSNESADVLARLQTNVIDIAPKIVILHVGANDLGHKVASETYLTNMNTIISTITTQLPDCTLFVDSIYPTIRLDNFNSRNLTKHRDNTAIANLNSKLNNICKKYEATNNVKFITSTYNYLFEGKGMNKTCTIDGLHLSGYGYRIISREIGKHIQSVN